jgi:hypothetical protein
MSLVYGNAAVNIAATNAKDGTAGLFFQRDSFGVRHQYISSSGGRNFGVLDNRFYDRCISESPLSSRAWAFQERYIGHRTLHCSAEQIFWECCEEMACETWPDGIATSMTDLFARKFPGREDFTVATGWEQAIKFYAGCQLTYLHDKMVAISGVARRVQSQLMTNMSLAYGEKTLSDNFAGESTIKTKYKIQKSEPFSIERPLGLGLLRMNL